MLKMLRITEEEAEAIRKKGIAINKKLLESGEQPLKDSELAHLVFELALKKVHVENGKIILCDD